MGELFCNFAQQGKYLVNNVPIRLKLTLSRQEFVLLAAESTPGYKFKILDASFHVLHVQVDPTVIVGTFRSHAQETVGIHFQRITDVFASHSSWSF